MASHDQAVAALHELERDGKKLANYDGDPNWRATKFQSVPLGAPLDEPPPFV